MLAAEGLNINKMRFSFRAKQRAHLRRILLLQQQLNRIAAQDPDIPTVAEDGIFGRGTQAAVLALQRKLGIDPTGAVGPVLWAKIVTQGAGY